MSEKATGHAAARPVFKVNDAVSHGNLSIFIIESGGQRDLAGLLTLEEAIESGVFVVHETATVNELAVENLSPGFEVFIQAGDIVKGGMQDRVFSSSVIIQKQSGMIPIESFCVESGRWSARGSEPMRRFSSSKERISSKELKLAAMLSRSQHDVWREVSDAQSKLGSVLCMSVADEESPSSLLLSLECEEVKASADEYVDALRDSIKKNPKAVGFAFAVNGRISGCDIFGSGELFRKLWPKLLKAAAVESLSAAGRVDAEHTATPDSVRAFLRRAERGVRAEREANGRCRIVTVDTPGAFVSETIDAETGSLVHRSFVRR
jgi:hypothetical protein